MKPEHDIREWGLDLGAMSDEKNAAIAHGSGEHNCTHPLSCHTGTDATFPWKICARAGCGCQVLME